MGENVGSSLTLSTSSNRVCIRKGIRIRLLSGAMWVRLPPGALILSRIRKGIRT